MDGSTVVGRAFLDLAIHLGNPTSAGKIEPTRQAPCETKPPSCHSAPSFTRKGTPTHPMPTMISIASGKGGVGKSVIAANLSLLLAKKGKQVVLADLDVGGADAHVLFGLFHPP